MMDRGSGDKANVCRTGWRDVRIEALSLQISSSCKSAVFDWSLGLLSGGKRLTESPRRDLADEDERRV